MIHLFNIEFNQVIKEMLPTIFKTKPFNTNDNFQWLASLNKPITDLKEDEFIPFRDNTIFDITHNGQVNSLEHYLNIYFNLPFPIDNTQSIWISDNEQLDANYMFLNSEFDTSVDREPYYLYETSELSVDTGDLEIKYSYSSANNGSYIELFDAQTQQYYYEKISDPSIKIIKENGYWVLNNTEWGIGYKPQFVKKWYLYDPNIIPPNTNTLFPTESYEKSYLYIKDEYLNNYSFIIHCPTSLMTYPDFEGIVYAIVNKYRTAGYTAIIQYY